LNSSDRSAGAAQRWRLDLAYDGSGFSGFAYQPQFVTIVGLLRETLARSLRLDDPPHIVGAGRTDAGVHAFAQVVHVDLPAPLFHNHRGPEPARLINSLNKQLAGRIKVLNARPVDATFHARYSASWREYRYLVLESPPPALELTSAWSWSVEGPLDVVAMNRSAHDALGTHDFRAFCRRPTGARADDPLTRAVLSARWDRLEDAWGLSPTGDPALRLTIRAVSFCHNMVRCLASTMVAIGQGRLAENIVRERLESHERAFLPPPAPAGGLTLLSVGYDEFAEGASGFVRWRVPLESPLGGRPEDR
jgi:tRNA pseudouridine38-40 synthase